MKVMQKHSKSSIFLLLVLPVWLMAQTNNFEFVQYDTNYVGSEDFIVLHGNIFSLAAVDQELTVTRVTHSMPDGWSNSFCVGPACLPPFLDEYAFTLATGDTAFFSMDTFPFGVEGVGSWTMFAVDSSTMEVDSVHITLAFVVVSVDDEISTPSGFNLSYIYPNPSNAQINFYLNTEDPGVFTISLYGLDGRMITSRDHTLRAGKNHLQWNLGTLPSGNYIIRATGAGYSVSRQVSIIK